MFETPKESQIIRKIATNHNCAADNCTTEFLLDAVDKWIQELEGAGWEVPPLVYPNVSEVAKINEAQSTKVPYDETVYLAAPASEGMLRVDLQHRTIPMGRSLVICQRH